MRVLWTTLIAIMMAVAVDGCVREQPVVTADRPGKPATTSPEPPLEPIPRLETGMHTAAISNIGVDSTGRMLATASTDKTVRLWSLPDGRLLRVLRVPLGGGNEGKIYAVALSSDGALVAAAGWTGWDWEGKASVYIFDVANGHLVRRLGGLSSRVRNLVFSRDDRFLAATQGENSGVHVWRTTDWQQVSSDTDYGDNTYGADFDGDGRLVTASNDGFVRLYDQDFERIARVRAQGGRYPYTVAFSPDGRRIAVGYHDASRVDVLSGGDLAFVFSRNAAGKNKGNLKSVAWSVDGRFLFAGGTSHDRTGTSTIRRWSDDGRGDSRDLEAARNTVVGIRPLPGGGIAFGTSDPAFGTYDAKGIRSLFRSSVIADFRNDRTGFQFLHDGTEVRFSLGQKDKHPMWFSVISPRLVREPVTDPFFAAPLIRAPGLSVTGWKNTYQPKLSGAPLKLKRYERSRSFAIAPDHSTFLLGTSWYLRQFGRDGKENWRVSAPGNVWGVNVSGDGRLAVAAFGDGTIRWFGMRDGVELLALFPHIDGKRWVLWTPKGYYAASPGGAELIGWHVNRGKDAAADFIPVSDLHNRPDVIERVLETLDEDEALRLADASRNK
jgi:WD40 repeat protein